MKANKNLANQQEIADENLRHALTIYILQILGGQNVMYGYDKIYDENGSTGEGFCKFNFELAQKKLTAGILEIDYLKHLQDEDIDFVPLMDSYDIIFSHDENGVLTVVDNKDQFGGQL